MSNASPGGTGGLSAGGPTILVAENDEQHRFVLRRVFRAIGMGVELRFVNDGQALLDYLERAAGPVDPDTPWPQLVLVDLHMPRLDGIGALQAMRMRDRLRAMPTIVFSSSDQPHHVDQAYASGANAYLVKVGDFNQLVAHLRGMIGFWLEAARLPRRPNEMRPSETKPDMPSGLAGKVDPA